MDSRGMTCAGFTSPLACGVVSSTGAAGAAAGAGGPGASRSPRSSDDASRGGAGEGPPSSGGSPPLPAPLQHAALGLLDWLAFGVVAIGLDGAVHWSNSTAAAMLEDSESLMTVRDRLCGRTPRDAALFTAALDAVRDDLAAGRQPAVGVFSPRGLLPEEHTAALLVPLGTAAPPQVAVLLCPRLDRRLSGVVPLLMGAFGLTRREAELVQTLAGGNTLEDFSRDHGITRGTARWHLRNTLFKMGCGRQGHAVARLLASPLTLVDLGRQAPRQKQPRRRRPDG